MNINDPVGDLITRIRNAHLRGRSKTHSPASTLRTRVLQVLKDEGYIRDFREIEKEGRKELEIELKYFEGAPAIHEITARFEAGPPRLFVDQRSSPRPQRPRHFDHLDPQGRDERQRRP